MRTRIDCTRSILTCIALSFATFPFSSCSPDNTPDGSTHTIPASEPDHTYHARGVIVQLPIPGRITSELMIRHEAIPDFKNHEDVTIGMNSMTMAFPTTDSLSLDGLTVGDTISFTFSVWWKGRIPEWYITEIVKLPNSTELDFSPLTPNHTQPETAAPDSIYY